MSEDSIPPDGTPGAPTPLRATSLLQASVARAQETASSFPGVGLLFGSPASQSANVTFPPRGSSGAPGPSATHQGSTTGTQAPSGDSSARPVSLPKANMGVPIKYNGVDWAIRMGEIPNLEWTSAEPFYSPSAFQFRSPHHDTWKATQYRQGKDLDFKLDRNKSLEEFKEVMGDHLKKHGMISIAYLPDPRKAKPDAMVNCIDYANLFTPETAIAASAKLSKKWDDIDKANDRDAYSLLKALCSRDLWREMKKQSGVQETFVVSLIKILNLVKPHSKDYFDGIKTRLENLHPSKCPGQNIRQFTKQALELHQILEEAGYDHFDLVGPFLKALTESGGNNVSSTNRKWKQEVFELRSRYEALEEEVQFYDSNKDKLDALAAKGLTFYQVSIKVDRLYDTSILAGEWEPAISTVDKAKVPPSFQANVLIPNGGRPSPNGKSGTPTKAQKDTTCFNCGKEGHWSKDCPQPPKAQSNAKGNTKGGRRDRKGSGAHQTNQSWRRNFVGDTTQHNGKTFHWCKKCNKGQGQYTTSHKTETHTGAPPSDPQANAAFQAAAWNISIERGSIGSPCVPPGSLGGPWLWIFLAALSLASFFPSFGSLLATTFKSVWSQTAAGWYTQASAVPITLAGWFGALLHLLLHLAPVLWQTLCEWNLALLAPLLWLITFFLGLWGAGYDDDDPHRGYSRQTRRQFQAYQRRCQRKRPQPRGLTAHGVHRRYPFRLRTTWRFLWKPTSAAFRLRQTKLQGALQFLFGPGAGRRGERLWKQWPYLPGAMAPQIRPRHKDPTAPTIRRRKQPNGMYTRPPEHGPVPLAQQLRPKSKYRHVPAPPPHGFAKPGITTHQRRAIAEFQRFRENLENKSFQHNPYDPAPGFKASPKHKITKHHANMAKSVPHMEANLKHVNAFIDPLKARQAIDASQCFEIIWDSGASMSITFCEGDFISEVRRPSVWRKMLGMAKGLMITGEGEVAWSVMDEYGSFRILVTTAYLVPKSPVRLLSTTTLLRQHEGESITLDSQKLRLSGLEMDPSKTPITVMYHPSNNLPVSVAYRPSAPDTAAMALNATISTVSRENINLTEPEKELLRWHQRFGHMDFKKVQFLLGLGVLGVSASKKSLHRAASKLQTCPKCAACQFGKQTARPAPGNKSTAVKDRQGAISADKLMPGQQISVDHFVCSTLGRTLESRGKGAPNSQYKGGCIFIDASSKYVHVELQRHMNSHETLQAKTAFEQHCRNFGVVPQTYLSDNGKPFTSTAFADELQQFHQIIRFAGVGAHHHNGEAERAIRTIMSISRTMMLHAAIHWPDTADPALWPMAVQHAVFIYNHIPRSDTGLSPHDLFTRQRYPTNKLHDIHVWGCPAYVLDKTVQDGKKLPRWSTRGDRRMYMGISPDHHSSAGLCLNLETGAITPQYHVVYDDWFATVTSTEEALDYLTGPEWQALFGDSNWQYGPLGEDLQDPTEDLTPAMHRDAVATAMEHRQPQPVPPYVEPLYVPPPSPGPPLTDSPHRRTPVLRELPRSPNQPEACGQEVPTPVPLRETPVPQRERPLRENLVPQRASPQREKINIPRPAQIIDLTREDLEPTQAPATPPIPVRHVKPEPASPPPHVAPRATKPVPRYVRELNSHNNPGHQEEELRTTRRQRAKRQHYGDMIDPDKADPSNFEATLPYAATAKIAPAQQCTWCGEYGHFKPECNKVWTGPVEKSDEEHSCNWCSQPGHKTLTCPNLWMGHPSPKKAPQSFTTPPLTECLANYVCCQAVGTDEWLPYAYAAPSSDPDTYTWQQCMEDEDHRDEWLEAALAEVRALEAHGTWEEVPESEATSKILPGTWVGRVKRRPDGTVIKRKMRYCVRGDLQEGDIDSHSQVAAWSSVRLLLVLALTLGWYTCCCDFSNAFVQATLKNPIWIHLPRGFSPQSPKGNKTILRLIKSLYGQAEAPKLWQEHLAKALMKLGFKRSPHDRCVFYKDGAMLVTFVDDVLFAWRSKEDADKFFEELKAQKFDFTVEESVTSYLGIKFEHSEEDGSYTLTQPGLIDKIIEDMGMEDCNPNKTPSARVPLGKDAEGTPFKGPWNYRSIVGKLLYLSTNTRPDISYAVSQVCRFSHDPKESHARAIKMIVRYLKGTRTQGTIVRPTGNLNLEAYCDADFAGLYGTEAPEDPNSVKSRMGYIIKLGGCPIVWKSQLIPDVTLSTAESEYAALSACMRVMIPLRRLLTELAGGLGLPQAQQASVSARVFEDNNAALQLAVNQRITSRTRHYQVKWHHFWTNVKRDDGETPDILVMRVESALQDADYFTKGLPHETFVANRRRVQGW